MALQRWRRLVEVKNEFGKYLLSVAQTLTFDGMILTIIALDALCIGVQASEFIARKSGKIPIRYS